MLTVIRFSAATALVTYAGALAFVLLAPAGSIPSGLVTDAISLGIRLDAPPELVQRSRVEFGLNVLAFTPLSLLGSLLRPSITVSAWTAAAFAISLAVEGIQATMSERMAAHSDVVANTAGAAAGALVAWVLLQPFRRRLEGRANLADRDSPTQQDQLSG